jgi:hypothetical protein
MRSYAASTLASQIGNLLITFFILILRKVEEFFVSLEVMAALLLKRPSFSDYCLQFRSQDSRVPRLQ